MTCHSRILYYRSSRSAGRRPRGRWERGRAATDVGRSRCRDARRRENMFGVNMVLAEYHRIQTWLFIPLSLSIDIYIYIYVICYLRVF